MALSRSIGASAWSQWPNARRRGPAHQPQRRSRRYGGERWCERAPPWRCRRCPGRRSPGRPRSGYRWGRGDRRYRAPFALPGARPASSRASPSATHAWRVAGAFPLADLEQLDRASHGSVVKLSRGRLERHAEILARSLRDHTVVFEGARSVTFGQVGASQVPVSLEALGSKHHRPLPQTDGDGALAEQPEPRAARSRSSGWSERRSA